MKKEDYIRKLSELHYDIELLKEAYIEANKPCEIGQLIEVQEGKKFNKGIVTGFEIGYSKEVKIRAKKLKKDGTASSIDMHIYNWTKLSYLHPVL